MFEKALIVYCTRLLILGVNEHSESMAPVDNYRIFSIFSFFLSKNLTPLVKKDYDSRDLDLSPFFSMISDSVHRVLHYLGVLK